MIVIASLFCLNPLYIELYPPFPTFLGEFATLDSLLPWNPRMHRVTLIILIYRRLRYYSLESKADRSISLIQVMELICIRVVLRANGT